MHQQSAPGLQEKLVPHREQRVSMTSLSHERSAARHREAATGAIVIAAGRIYHMAAACGDRGNQEPAKGTSSMKNPLDSLAQTITLGVVLTIVVVLLIHAIA